MTTGVDALADKHICPVLYRLCGSSDISDLDEDQRARLEGPQVRDNALVRLFTLAWSEEPDGRRTMLLDDWQRGSCEMTDGGMACKVSYTDGQNVVGGGSKVLLDLFQLLV